MSENVDWGAYVRSTTIRYAVRYLRYALREALDRTKPVETLEEELDDLLINPTSMQLQKGDLDRLETELPNILSGIERLYQLEQWYMVAGTVRAVSDLLYIRGYWDKAMHYGELALEAARKTRDEWAVAEFTYMLGIFSQRMGDYLRARQQCESSITLFEELNDKLGIARSLYQLGVTAHYQERYNRSKEHYEASLAAFRELSDKQGVASCLHGLATIAFSLGDYAEAERLYEASLKLKRELGDQRSLAHTSYQLANVAYSQGDYSEALRRCKDTLEIKKEIDYKSGVARSLYQLGIISQAQGDFTEASSSYQESMRIREELGDQKGIAIVLERQGCITEDLSKAQQMLSSALELNEKLGNKAMKARNLYNLGLIFERQGNFDKAQEVYSQALSIFSSLNSHQVPIVRESLRRTKLWIASEQQLHSDVVGK